MQEKAIEEQMVAVKDVVMEPTMKTLSDQGCPLWTLREREKMIFMMFGSFKR